MAYVFFRLVTERVWHAHEIFHLSRRTCDRPGRCGRQRERRHAAGGWRVRSVSDSDGCLFTGTINDQYFSTNLAGHPNSYLNAVNAYNAYVAINPAAGPAIALTPIGQSAGDPASWTPPYPSSDPIVDTTGTNVIGAVIFDPNSNLKSGDWTLLAGGDVSFLAVDGGNKFDLYKLDTPSTSGTWNTYDIPTGNLGLTNPQLFRLVLFSSNSPLGPIGAVPEPATWTMFVMGFGLIGASMRALRRGQTLARV
jgi:hypothetical protein